MLKFLNSSTSLTFCVALVGHGIMPAFVAAQSMDVVVCGKIKEQESFPCTVEDGLLLESKQELRAYRKGQRDAEKEAAIIATQKKGSVAEVTDDAALAAKVAEEQAKVEQPVKDEQAVRAEVESPEQEAAKAASDAAAQSESANQVELEQALEGEQSAAEAGSQPEPETEPATEVPNDAAIEQTAVETDTTQQNVDPTAIAQAQEQILDEKTRAARKAERQAERRAERQAEREAARRALEEQAGEVITEEVTTENTRRSDQDFETTATGASKAKDDSGLSGLEKALLVGLGAVVVGTVLKNGDKVLSNSGDRVVLQDEGGELRVLKDDDALLRRPGDEVRTERFSDGSTRQTVLKPDGGKIVTIRSSDGTVLRRTNIDARGNEIVLFDDLADEREVVVRDLPPVGAPSLNAFDYSEAQLRAALIAEQSVGQERGFSLRQVREIGEVRALAPQIELDAARFASSSAAIAPEQARNLSRVGNTMRQLIQDDPRTVFLIEGHTDAVGDATYNLALSDRRAETVALALTEYFDVPPENMIIQGYGESALKVNTALAEQANRRAVVRNITDLLRRASNETVNSR